MLVVLARVGRLGSLLANDAELLGRQHGLPFVGALLDRVVGHVFVVGGAAAEEGAEEGDAGHGAEEGRRVAGGGAGERGGVAEGGWRCRCEGCGEVGEGEGADEGWEAHVWVLGFIGEGSGGRIMVVMMMLTDRD